MKTTHKFLMIAALLIFFIDSIEAQGWTQNRKGIYSLGVGAAQGYFLPVYNYPGYRQSSEGISFNVSGEYDVHRVIGIGWQTGLNVFVRGHYYDKNDDVYYTSTAVGIPLGFKMNIHILEAANASIRDKLDVYAGFNLGAGPTFHGDPYGGVYSFFYVGPQAGIRIWLDNRVALFSEIGWGATIINFGVTF